MDGWMEIKSVSDTGMRWHCRKHCEPNRDHLKGCVIEQTMVILSRSQNTHFTRETELWQGNQIQIFWNTDVLRH